MKCTVRFQGRGNLPENKAFLQPRRGRRSTSDRAPTVRTTTMRLDIFACIAALGCLWPAPGEARVTVTIDLHTQTMHVRSDSVAYDWPVSTARSGYRTPRGSYRPTLLKRMHYSRKYDWSPMPHSIFFNGGYAIHGTYETRFLGRPASHGCIRLAPSHAARLFEMVQEEGASITIVGSPPGKWDHELAQRRIARESNFLGDVGAAQRPHALYPQREWPDYGY